MEIKITPFEPAVLKQYITFAKNTWGNVSYQASENYLNWLYLQNPLSKGQSDFLIAQNNEGELVGCIHKLRQNWLLNGETVEVPAIHNLHVLEAYRKGAGALLILEALKKETSVLIPGCNENLAKLYRTIKCQEIDACWYHYILKPIVARVKYLKEKFISATAHEVKLLTKLREYEDIQWTANPDDTLLDKLLLTYERSNQFAVKQYYDKALLKWRFFNPIGPKHILVYHENTQGLFEFIIVSIGLHQGLRLARFVETAFSPMAFKKLYNATLNLLKHNDVDMLSIFSADPDLNTALQQAGHKPIKKKTLTFLYDKNKQISSNSCRISAAAGDFGFDAIRSTT